MCCKSDKIKCCLDNIIFMSIILLFMLIFMFVITSNYKVISFIFAIFIFLLCLICYRLCDYGIPEILKNSSLACNCKDDQLDNDQN